MKIYVQCKEGDAETQWRQQVTLPKKWLDSPCERLRGYLVGEYNKARPTSQLIASEWHLSNEMDGCSEVLGMENMISEVIGDFDQVSLRRGASVARTAWRRSNVKPAAAAAASVLVPVDFDVLTKLQDAVNADDTVKLKQAVDEGNIASPHEILMAETDVKSSDGRVIGTEWHSMGGRFAWDMEEAGRGEDPAAKLSLTAYARQKGAARVLKLIEIADHCGGPILGSSRGRDTGEIEASAATVAAKMHEMNSQLQESLEQRA